MRRGGVSRRASGPARALRAALLLLVPVCIGAEAPAAPPRDLTADLAAWQAAPAAGVEMHLAAAPGPHGEPGLRLDYDFHGHAGWAAARRAVAVELPPRYEVRWWMRGDGPRNNLELKLVEPHAAGDAAEDVWWHVDRAREWPAAWTPVRVKQRQITFAWGPSGGKHDGGVLRRVGAVELTVSAAEGGRGSLWIAGLEIAEVPPLATQLPPPRAEADVAEPEHPAAAALDGDLSTAWRPGAGGGSWTLDMGGVRELGGVSLLWAARDGDGARAGAAAGPQRLTVELSSDGAAWTPGRVVTRGGGARSDLMLPDAEARYLRLRIPAGGCGDAGCGLAEAVVLPLAAGESTNDFVKAVAAATPRGSWPRGFTEGEYWTVVGVAGDPQESLFSEDGRVESGERGFSLEPFVRLDGRTYDWSLATTSRALADGDLPLPSVTWTLPGARLEIAPVATGAAGASTLLARYRLVNTSAQPLRGELVLAVRPFQVDPPYQFLNGGGGVAPLHRLACDGARLRVEGVARVAFAPPPAGCGTLAFDEGPLLARLAAGAPPAVPEVDDDTGLATAALRWPVALAPGAATEVVAALPYVEPHGPPVDARPIAAAAFTRAASAARATWRAALDRVGFEVPPEQAAFVRTLRSNLGFVLVHRDGPAIQPGSRSYARSWIRDGAFTGVALLRLRHAAEAADFASWFAGFQYPDGKVPCCVDRRGADPVPENDSHGELVHLIAEVHRYTGDRAGAERLLPHVERAVDAIEALRQQRRTAEYASGPRRLFFGLLPESISHEGYSARPVHSYWDDTFAYRGLDDAVELATALGRADLARAWAARRDAFRADLLASIAAVRREHALATLPASADLADYDPTSSATLLEPGGLLAALPREAVDATFERSWQELEARFAGRREWDVYTPYELRQVGAFLRLAVAEPRARATWQARAHALLADYRRDQRPPEWNGWPEAVVRDLRAPHFLGDLPHGWVGAEVVRAWLDLLALDRADDHALVLGAGVLPSWLDGGRAVGVRDLATPYGILSYRLARQRGAVVYTVAPGLRLPPGGLVLVPPGAGAWRARADGAVVPLAADGTVTLHRLASRVELVPLSSPGDSPASAHPHGGASR